MFIRLWFFTPRMGSQYPEGGTYDTSVFDDDTGNCADPRQFDRFQALMEYANTYGEELQQVTTPEEAYGICSRNRLTPSAMQCSGGPTNNETPFNSAISRPVSACGMPFVGGGSRTGPPPCPVVPPVTEPSLELQPITTTITDHARRVISLARQNKIVPTIVY